MTRAPIRGDEWQSVQAFIMKWVVQSAGAL
jgi:hypothetical protein